MEQRSETVARRTRAESKEFTRHALLQAGLMELVEHGLDAPSLDSICARAGFTRGAFYVHFKDRDEFLIAVTDWVLTSIVEGMLGVDGELDVGAALGRFMAFISDRHLPEVGSVRIATHRIFESIARSEQLQHRFAEICNDTTQRVGKLLARAQGAGQVRRDLDPAQTARVLLALGIGAMSLADTGAQMGDSALQAGILGLLKA